MAAVPSLQHRVMPDHLLCRGGSTCDRLQWSHWLALALVASFFVERVQVLRWNPVFRMERAPDLLNSKATQVVRLHFKLRDEPCAACLYIPISRDLNGVVFVRDRIENRLIGQARWELTPS